MVQIYQNPTGLHASQVAIEHNPEFATLNSIAAGYADAPITAALAQMEMNDKFGGLKGALMQKQIDRRWKQQDEQDNYLRNLQGMIAMSGRDPSQVTDVSKAFTTLSRINSPSNNPLPNFDQVIGSGVTNVVPNVTQLQQNASIPVPNMTQSLRNKALGIDYTKDLQDLAKAYREFETNPNIDRSKFDNMAEAFRRKQINDNLRQLPKPTAISAEGKPDTTNDFAATLRGLFNFDNPISGEKATDYNAMYNQTLENNPWANITGDVSGMTDGIVASRKYNMQQKLMRDVNNRLNDLGVTPLTKETITNILDDLRNAGYDPSNHIPVADNMGRIYLFNVSETESPAEKGLFLLPNQ